MDRTNKITKKDLRAGDHIYAYRHLHCYTHHGIYIGEDRVIHFNRTEETNTTKPKKRCGNCEVDRNQIRAVVNTCVDCFLKGHTLRRYRYHVSHKRYLTNWTGTCTTGRADLSQDIIIRATDMCDKKGGFGDYDLFENNCESFAVFCSTGKRVSDQATTVRLLLTACMKVARDRLLGDVWVHYGEVEYNKLKDKMSSVKAFIASIQEQQD